MGARPLARKINELIKVPLSKKILFENIKNCYISIDFDTEFLFDIQEHKMDMYILNSTDENGYIIFENLKPNLELS